MAVDRRTRDRWLSIRAAYCFIILAVVTACVAIRQADPSFVARLRLLGFDLLQQTAPRLPDTSYPVRVVDIDEKSIQAFGNWPWRRDILAKLVDKLVASGARVVAFDMVFPDAATGAIAQLPAAVREAAEFKPLLDKLAAGETHDDTFAKALRNAPAVLGIIGTSQASTDIAPSKASFATVGENAERFLPAFRGASSNLAELEQGAAGVGALNWFPDHDQILRRIPTVMRIGDNLYPSLAIETLRVLNRSKTIAIRSAGDGGFTGDRGVTTVAVGDTVIPTDSDGHLWLRFSRHDPKRSVSAADVLQGRAGEEQLKGRVAIIGTSAAGLLDLRATPLDPVISGVEINAEAVEQLLSKKMLVRPDFARGMEISLAVLSALILSCLVYLSGAGIAAIVGFASVCIFAFGSLWAFTDGILLDAVFPIMANSAVYIFGTGYLYYEAESERNLGRQTLLRIAQEMEAAAQIQRTFLPKDVPSGALGHKFDIAAVMKPAKSIGGDFYDYFLIGDRQLGFAVGDVSGKGVPAALFMSVSRTVLRTIAFDGEQPGNVLSRVNAILSRDNTEGMFVTIFYALLDLETGVIAFSSAGHDDALLIRAAGTPETLHYMGPAIGLFEGSEFPTATRNLESGDMMLLLTDGITEAFNIDGRVFGAERLVKSVKRQTTWVPSDLVNHLTAEIARFSEGAEQSDDITCVAIQFRG